MKLNLTPRVGIADPLLQRELREHALQVNQLSEGRISAAYNAMPTVPTVGTFARGDFIRNSLPSEAGTTGSKFVVYGWLCVDGGTPGTFVQCRFLTGN